MRKSVGVFVLLFLVFASPSFSKRESHKFALALYHFNLQYVAGAGERSENAIIKETLGPLIDFYLKHPNWGGDIEMQGMMIEAVAERFPKIFQGLKTIVNRQQVDLVSFHYSDQLFLAYPRHDLLWSEQLQKALFKRLDILRSPTVFTQEGQFGQGMLHFMRKHGMRIAILPGNLFSFLYPEAPFYPYYQHSGVYVVSKGGTYRQNNLEITLHWSYLDDAELLPTGGVNPYFRSSFRYKKDAMDKYEQKLRHLEEEGYKIVTVREYVQNLKALGIKPKPLPPIIDGTWQPKDTDNLFQWMGKRGIYNEMDMEILSKNYANRVFLLAAEKMVALDKQDEGELKKKIAEAWRHQLLAQVSDATGWNPFPVEMKYSISEREKAREIALAIIEQVRQKKKLKTIILDTETGKLLSRKPEEKGEEIACPIQIEVEATVQRKSVVCERRGESRTDLTITLDNGKEAIAGLLVRLPREGKTLRYSPALLDDQIVSIPLSAFGFEKATIPLANGLIGIGGKRYLIVHNTQNHLGCRVYRTKPVIEFQEQSSLPSPVTLRFSLVQGPDKKALHYARKINLFPIFVYP